MRNQTRISLALVASAAMVGMAALPASAVEETLPPAIEAPGDTEASATLEVEGGILSISVAENVAAEEPLKPGRNATIAIPSFTVTDERAGTAGWGVTVTLSEFTSVFGSGEEALTETIPVEEASYTPTVVGVPKGDVAVSPGGGEFGVVVTAVSATDVHGNNSATWTSALEVPVPDNALAGTYTATLTHSIL